MSDGAWSNLASGLMGSIIGGVISLATSLWTINKQNKHNKKLEDINTINSLSAIQAELDAVYARYSSKMGSLLENCSADQCPFVIFEVKEEYFPIYKNNTSTIGKIKSNDARTQVITAYTLAVAMIDSVRINNALVERINQQKTDEGRLQATKEARQYWDQLRTEHHNLREAAKLAYRALGHEIQR